MSLADDSFRIFSNYRIRWSMTPVESWTTIVLMFIAIWIAVQVTGSE